MRNLLIDTASIHHSASALNKRVDYLSLVDHIIKDEKFDITFFADSNALGFIKYLSKTFDHRATIFTKSPIRKRIGKGERIWYLSFAVEMGLFASSNSGWDTFLVTSDIETVGILKYHKGTFLYGLGIPKILRDHAYKWYDIPLTCLTEKINDPA